MTFDFDSHAECPYNIDLPNCNADRALLIAEGKRLQAENEALRNGMRGDYDLDGWLEWFGGQKRLEAENARLREALSAAATSLELTRWHPEGNLNKWAASAEGMNHGRVMDALHGARAALAGKGDDSLAESATHRCKICGALWRLNPAMAPEEHDKRHCRKDDCPLLEESWSVKTPDIMGKCCDMVAMGDQIEPLAGKGEG